MKQKTVLILEDEKMNREILKGYIQKHPNLKLIFEAVDGLTAEEACLGMLPDIAILDIDVPIKSGLKVARSLQNTGIKILFSTVLKSHALEAFQLGVVGYLLKPYKEEIFNQTINRMLGIESSIFSLDEYLKEDYRLSPSEVELCVLISSGVLRAELAEITGKSERAIKALLQGVYRKTINGDPGLEGKGRLDKFGRLVYFLLKQENKGKSF